MFSVKYIDYEEKYYKRIILDKDDKPIPGQDNTFKHYQSIIKQNNDYLTKAPYLESIIPLSEIIPTYEQDKLHDLLYNFYGKNKSLKDEIKKITKENSLTQEGMCCPYCGILRNKLRDLDHYMPREKYPEFSIHPNNLIYVCSDCNQRPNKGTKFLDEDKKRMFLNPYYDNLNDIDILDCEIKTKDIMLLIKFHVRKELKKNNPYIYNIAVNHLRELHLIDRYEVIVRTDFLKKFIRKFTDKKDKNPIKMKNFTVEECQLYIEERIEELTCDTISRNNFELVFWKNFYKCTTYFENLSNRYL